MHTPGPWKLSRTVDGFLAVAGPRGRNVCSVGADELFPDIIHDARLIAAAPDLLEALKAIKARYEGVFDHPALLKQGALNTNAATDMWAIANRAIAKAEGRN